MGETGVGYVQLTTQSDDIQTMPAPGVVGLGAYGGIRPSTDIPLIADGNGNPVDVFGDPHVKVLDIKYIYTQNKKHIVRETKAMFRLATVDVGGGRIRTRVVISRLTGDVFANGASSMVIEFISDTENANYVNHATLYDYDFDVAKFHKNELFRSMLAVQDDYASGLFEYDVLDFVILSGVRADGDDTSLYMAATDLIFTALSIPAYTLYGYDRDANTVKSDLGVVRPSGLFNQVSMPGKRAIGSRPDDFHSVSNLRMVAINTLRSTSPCFICFLDRVGTSAAETVSEDAEVLLGLLIV